MDIPCSIFWGEDSADGGLSTNSRAGGLGGVRLEERRRTASHTRPLQNTQTMDGRPPGRRRSRGELRPHLSSVSEAGFLGLTTEEGEVKGVPESVSRELSSGLLSREERLELELRFRSARL